MNTAHTSTTLTHRRQISAVAHKTITTLDENQNGVVRVLLLMMYLTALVVVIIAPVDPPLTIPLAVANGLIGLYVAFYFAMQAGAVLDGCAFGAREITTGDCDRNDVEGGCVEPIKTHKTSAMNIWSDYHHPALFACSAALWSVSTVFGFFEIGRTFAILLSIPAYSNTSVRIMKQHTGDHGHSIKLYQRDTTETKIVSVTYLVISMLLTIIIPIVLNQNYFRTLGIVFSLAATGCAFITSLRLRDAPWLAVMSAIGTFAALSASVSEYIIVSFVPKLSSIDTTHNTSAYAIMYSIAWLSNAHALVLSFLPAFLLSQGWV